MKRRDFLHQSAHLAAGASLFGALPGMMSSRLSLLPGGNPDNDRVLVAIFLNGGNDSLNTVVQLKDLSVLSALRSHVFQPQGSLRPLEGEELAFHSSLAGLHGLYHDGHLKVVRGVGYPDQNFSHFRSSDIWMSGSDAHEVVSTGWMGRYLNQTYPSYPQGFPNATSPHPLAIELGFSNSLLFQGSSANMSVVINGERDFYSLVDDTSPTPDDSLAGRQLAHVRLIRRQSQQYGSVIQEASSKASSQLDYPNTEIAGQLKIVARMIAGGLQTPMYKVELGGFDTHAGQVDPTDPTQGLHAWLLHQLDEAIVAFLADLEHLGVSDRVLGMTFSEFGRRIVSNSSLGTDHGAAGPLFLFGKPVASGVIGTDHQLDRAMTFEDNLPWQYDFRQVYGSILEQWLCVPRLQVDEALGGQFDAIPLLDPSLCQESTPIRERNHARDFFTLAPNPVQSHGRVTLTAPGGEVRINLLDQAGRVIRPLLHRRASFGKVEHAFEVSYLPPGTYFVAVQTAAWKQARPFTKI